MGSIAFMKLMRVRVPEGTRLKQAVYLSVNGELAAVFALNYAPQNPFGQDLPPFCAQARLCRCWPRAIL